MFGLPSEGRGGMTALEREVRASVGPGDSLLSLSDTGAGGSAPHAGAEAGKAGVAGRRRPRSAPQASGKGLCFCNF